jgi:hypothetical protein|tara:strand:- start:2515 stop:2865 length:351 start_codon:yes stop_codon:yes gene_type:complete
MGRRMPNGQRLKYVLNDGSAWTVPEAQAKMLELHKEPASESLMHQRLKHSTDPEYIFLKKKGKWTKDGGHVYSQINFARKKAKVNQAVPKPKPEPKLTAKEKKLKQAYISIGLSWT